VNIAMSFAVARIDQCMHGARRFAGPMDSMWQENGY